MDSVSVPSPSTRRRRRRRRSIGALAIALLLALCAACGTRWTDDQRAEMAARYSGDGDGPDSGRRVAPSSGTGAAGSEAGGERASAGATGPGAATGIGSSDPNVAAGGPAPCDAPSDAPGVSASEISIGTLNSLSGPIPGLGTSHLAATKAYAEYRNANGGVCGRKVRLVTGDDGGDNSRNRSLVADMGPKVLAIVPGIAGGGDGGADLIASNRIPAVGTAVSPRLETVPTYFGVRPPLPDYHAVVAKYRYLVEQGVRSAAVVYVAAASAPAEAGRNRQLMEAAGIRIALDLALPLTTLSYDSAARSVANSGADYLFFVHDQGASAAMARSLAGVAELRFSEYIVAYGSRFIDLAGDAAEGATSWVDSLPVEDGGANPEQAAYIEWMDRVSPDAVLDPFAALGWAGTKALLDTLAALPGPITRDALLAQLEATHAYDAGGLIAPIDLGAKHGRGCLLAMIVRDGRWQRLTPKSGFAC